MNQKIPMLDLTSEIESLWDELHLAIDDVLRSGQFIMGQAVRDFEQDIAAYLGVRHAIGVNSGTDALLIALRALGVQPGDEVITTSFTFFATGETISLLGAIPVFVDIDPATLNLDPAKLATALTPRTKAIVPVHLFGLAVPMQPIMDFAAAHDLAVVEDTAQAFGGIHQGKKLGSIGNAGAFSFFPSKNLGAYGDGGLIATNDDDVAQMARKLRTHGSLKKYHNEILGYNSRLDSLQAAILRVKLPHVDSWNAQRRQVAGRYSKLLAGIPGLQTPMDDGQHVYHQYTIRLADGKRETLREALEDCGIASNVYYPKPLHQLPVYSHLDVDLPNTDAAAAEVLSLPIWPTLDVERQQLIAQTIRDVLNQVE